MVKKTPRLSRRAWIRGAVGGGAAMMVGSSVYAWRIEPYWVRIERRKMRLRNLPEAWIGKRIVQLSDLHVGPVVDNAYLRASLRRVATLEPDLLLLSGDFMTSQSAEEIPLTLDTLRDAPVADVPTLAVLGNHDYGDAFRDRSVARELADGLDALGVRVLRNESTEIDGLQFAGSDDLWAGRCHVHDSLSGIDPERPTVYMAHNPDICDVAGWSGFNGWILSGHTHGGQCRFPLIGAPILPVRNRRYIAGHVRLDRNRDLYVNRGLGYKHPIRFGVRPEVTVFTLDRAKDT